MMKIIKILVFVAVLVLIVIFISVTDLGQLGDDLSRIGFGFGWVILTSFGAYILGALAWKECIVND